MPIAAEKGKRRPHDPVQAAKFASESGVIIRDKVPVLKHWKDYKDNERYYNNYVGKLAVSTLLFLWLSALLILCYSSIPAEPELTNYKWICHMTRRGWPLTKKTRQQRKHVPICCARGCGKCVIG